MGVKFTDEIVQVISIMGIFLLAFITPEIIQDGIHLIYGILFLIIIINTCSNPKAILKLENRVYKFLGKISFGIYMYHFMLIFGLVKLLNMFFGFNYAGAGENIVLYIFSILSTILVSYLSYEFLEKNFIKMKIRYSKILSGENAKQNT